MEQLEGPPPPAAPPPPPPPPQKCPRCDSSNTKFCYYNNYSLSQPRYFCKACRRYWTRGGTLRNVPVGGGCRRSRTKRPKLSPSNPPGISHPFSAAPPVGYNGNNHPFYGGGGGAFMSFYSGAGDNMAFLQSIRSDDRDDLIIPSQEFVLSMNPGTTTSWTQSFIRSSPGPSISSWSRAAGDGEHHSAGLYSFDRNRAGLD